MRLATSPVAPWLGQRVPVRGPGRLLNRSYARVPRRPGRAERQLTTALGDEFVVDLASFQEWQLWAFGTFERHVAELFGWLVRPGDRCVDVGANIGLHTVRLARLAGPGGEVTAVEPDPDIAARARGNIALNGLGNVRLVQAAASATAGQEVALYRAADSNPNRAMGSLIAHPHLTAAPVRVPTVTVDELCPAPVALMKIDVEGHEAGVVTGAGQMLRRDMPAVVFEYEPGLLAGPQESPFQSLQELGYQLLRICWRPRNRASGRGRLELEPINVLPPGGSDLLAVSGDQAARVRSLVRA